MKLPKGFNEITIGQFIDLLPSSMKGLSESKKVCKTISILSGLDFEYVYHKVPKAEVLKCIKQLSFLSGELPQGKPQRKFKVNGVWYELVEDANRLSGGQYMRTQTILKDLAKDPETIDKNLHLILANVCVPMERKGVRLKIKTEYDIKEVATEFYDYLTIDIAYPIIIFFCTLSKNLIPFMQDYLTQKSEKVKIELLTIQKDLQNSMDGLSH